MTVRETVAEHFWLKVVSLFLALLLWLFASSGMEGEIAVTAPVSYRNLSPGLAVRNDVPGSVSFTIAGPKMLLWRAEGHAFRVTLDLHGIGAGDVTFPHLEKYAEIQPRLRITRVYPSTILLHLEKVERDAR